MNDFDKNFDWQRQFLPEVKRILGEHLISEAPPELDKRCNTDLIVFRLDTVRVSCRIRRAAYIAHREEFTIRSQSPKGGVTELRKVLRGLGDYFFYGFGGRCGELVAWHLCDLSEFRSWFVSSLHTNGGKLPGEEKYNGVGDSRFRVFKYAELPGGFVIAKGGCPGADSD